MNEDGLEKFVRSLYSDDFDKDGLVIDVRNNGGGFTHDQVLNYLAGREHAHSSNAMAAKASSFASSTANGPSRSSC